VSGKLWCPVHGVGNDLQEKGMQGREMTSNGLGRLL